MNTKLQQDIAAANKRTQKARGRQFAKRASDEQMLDHIVTQALVVVDEYALGGRVTGEAIKNLRTAAMLAQRRAR